MFSLLETQEAIKYPTDTVQRDEQLQRITDLQDFIKDQTSDLKVDVER